MNQRKGYSTREAQNEANKRYYHSSEEVRQRRMYQANKSQAKGFVLKKATREDLLFLKGLIDERLKDG